VSARAPVRADADVHDERHRKLRDRRHLFDKHGLDAVELALRRFEHELIVHLKQQLRRKAVSADPIVDGDHRQLDEVSRRALHRRIDRSALGRCAAGPASRVDVRYP